MEDLRGGSCPIRAHIQIQSKKFLWSKALINWNCCSYNNGYTKGFYSFAFILKKPSFFYSIF